MTYFNNAFLTLNPIASRDTVEDGERVYRVKNKETYFPSVTSILDVATPKSLKTWMKNKSAAFQEKTLERTANIGTKIHEAIELDLKGLVPEITPDIEPAFNEWIKLKLLHDIKAEFTEIPVYSLKYGYAGTIDILGTYDSQPCIMDIKTGFVGVKAGWQMAAYLLACLELQMVKPQGLGMVAISVHRDGKVGQPFKYQHIDWCLDSFAAAFKIYKSFNFTQLHKDNWEYLHQDQFLMSEDYYRSNLGLEVKK